MRRNWNWLSWLRELADLDRTPEEILSARLDEIEKQLRENPSHARNNR